MSFENLSTSQKIRATLHRDVQAICIETCHFLGLEITKPAMEIVAELVYKKLSVYGADLEAFAKHAKRVTINKDDVKLLARRCPSLKSHLNILEPPATTPPKEKRRKTVAGKHPETPAPKPKETETPTLKPRETETMTSKRAQMETSKQQEMETVVSSAKDKDEQLDKMIVDEMIDLTFD